MMKRMLFLKVGVLISAVCVVGSAGTAWGDVVSAATGADLAGGSVQVTFRGGAMASATIVASGDAGTAIFPGEFSFSVAGETALADWTLTNLETGTGARDIMSFTIWLDPPGPAASISLFDDGTEPSTPVSLGGVAGAVRVGGPLIVSSIESGLWGDASNLGDMFTVETISWGGFAVLGIAPGATAAWKDDTDVIPEPATLSLLALGAMAAIRPRSAGKRRCNRERR